MKNTFLADIFFHDTCSLHYDIYGVRLAENEITRKCFASYFRSLFQSKCHTIPLNVVSVIIHPPYIEYCPSTAENSGA